MSDCEHCRNHWCCELDYKDKVEHCFFENPTDEYNATFTQEYKHGYQQGRADAIDECMDIVIDHNALITPLGYERILYDMAKLKEQTE